MKLFLNYKIFKLLASKFAWNILKNFLSVYHIPLLLVLGKLPAISSELKKKMKKIMKFVIQYKDE